MFWREQVKQGSAGCEGRCYAVYALQRPTSAPKRGERAGCVVRRCGVYRVFGLMLCSVGSDSLRRGTSGKVRPLA